MVFGQITLIECLCSYIAVKLVYGSRFRLAGPVVKLPDFESKYRVE